MIFGRLQFVRRVLRRSGILSQCYRLAAPSNDTGVWR
jgi:hypothetical protein